MITLHVEVEDNDLPEVLAHLQTLKPVKNITATKEILFSQNQPDAKSTGNDQMVRTQLKLPLEVEVAKPPILLTDPSVHEVSAGEMLTIETIKATIADTGAAADHVSASDQPDTFLMSRQALAEDWESEEDEEYSVYFRNKQRNTAKQADSDSNATI